MANDATSQVTIASDHLTWGMLEKELISWASHMTKHDIKNATLQKQTHVANKLPDPHILKWYPIFIAYNDILVHHDCQQFTATVLHHKHHSPSQTIT